MKRNVKGDSILDRFLNKIEKTETCWNWIAHFYANGYGDFRIYKNRKTTSNSAHRIAWMLFRGPIPEGMYVLHTCDNRKCVNPEHLYLGTQKENMQDMIKKGRHSHGCLRGTESPRAKLTQEQVDQIRKLYATDTTLSFRKLGKMFGVSKHCISRIVKNLGYQKPI